MIDEATAFFIGKDAKDVGEANTNYTRAYVRTGTGLISFLSRKRDGKIYFNNTARCADRARRMPDEHVKKKKWQVTLP